MAISSVEAKKQIDEVEKDVNDNVKPHIETGLPNKIQELETKIKEY